MNYIKSHVGTTLSHMGLQRWPINNLGE